MNEYIMAHKNFHTIKLVEQLVLVSYKDQLSNTEIIGSVGVVLLTQYQTLLHANKDGDK